MNKIHIQDTLLQSGKPILIKELNLLIYQPKLIEYVLAGGEEAIQIFLKLISLEPTLEDLQNFPGIKEIDIVYAVVNNEKDRKFKEVFNEFMKILFKDFNVEFSIDEKQKKVVLIFKNKIIENMPPIKLDNLDFILIKDYINCILNNQENEKEDFNPDSDKAKEIKAKLEKGNSIRNRVKNKNHTFLFNAISSFAIDQKLPIEEIYDKFTLYQFYNQYMRMNGKANYDIGLRAMMAGAKDVKLPDWQGSI